jgi:hypothetical protein
MARCRLSLRKIRRKIRPLIPRDYDVVEALVRGGTPHNLVVVFLLDRDRRKISGTLDTATGELTLNAEWTSLETEEEIGRIIAYVNGGKAGDSRPKPERFHIALNERDEGGRLIVRDVVTGRQTAALTDAEADAMFSKGASDDSLGSR